MNYTAIQEQVRSLVEQALEASYEVPNHAVYSIAAGCIALTSTLVYLYRRCTNGGEKNQENSLSRIHFFAGATPEAGCNVLCMAILRENPSMVNVPLSDKRYISHGYTPFLRACWNNNFELIHFMLSIGADISLTNADGESALYLVAYRVSKEKKWDPRALNLLWNSGCSVDAVNVHNNCMLHLAAKAGNTTLARWLILHGADVEVVNSAGFTPYTLALRKGSPAHLIVADLVKPYKDRVRREAILRSDGILLSGPIYRRPKSFTKFNEGAESPSTVP